jgi:capsid portal protein
MSDDYQYPIQIFAPELEQEENVFKKQDPFAKKWEDLKTLSGLEKNFKRRSDRIAKSYESLDFTGIDTTNQGYQNSALARNTGINGSTSKEINPGSVFHNGYGMFDVITPPWNLYELANYYDTSFANHAAIDAKVENIVGLGYDFHVSKRTLMQLEASSSDSAVEKARKRIERAKVELKEWLESLNSDDSFTNVMTKFYTDVQATGNGYLEIGRTVAGEIGYIGHIPATTMRVRRLRDGYVQIIGQKVVYFRNFGAKNPNPITGDPRPNEIIHYKEYSP